MTHETPFRFIAIESKSRAPVAWPQWRAIDSFAAWLTT